jgi:hypothetical protein
MTRRSALAAVSIVLLGSSPGILSAQDSQYWTLQYGPVAELLGGVVVGTTRDLSATYYNPGALALAKDPSVIASVHSFEYTNVTAATVPPLLDFADSDLGPSPSLFAVALPRKWTGSHTVAFSALRRQEFDLRTDNWQVTPSGHAGGESLFDQNLKETWAGLTWAHGVGERFGLGVTTYLAYRGHRARKEVSGAITTSPTQGASGLLVEDFDSKNYRLLWKAGLSTQRETWDLGLSVTTASVRLLGSGSASYVRSAVGADLGGGPVVSVDLQHHDDLQSSYQSPWSIAGGAGYRRGKNGLHATVEWFGSVHGFDVLDTSSLADDPGAADLVKRLHQQAKSVVNFGVGYQRTVSDRFSCYAAFTSDFTFADKENAATNALSTWDIYHLAAGTSFTLASVKLTLGAAYAFGNDTRSFTALVVPPSGAPVLTPLPLEVKYSRLRVLFGFDFSRGGP